MSEQRFKMMRVSVRLTSELVDLIDYARKTHNREQFIEDCLWGHPLVRIAQQKRQTVRQPRAEKENDDAGPSAAASPKVGSRSPKRATLRSAKGSEDSSES